MISLDMNMSNHSTLCIQIEVVNKILNTTRPVDDMAS